MTERTIVRNAQRLTRMGFILPVPAFMDSEGRELQGRVYDHILAGFEIAVEDDGSGNQVLVNGTVLR